MNDMEIDAIFAVVNAGRLRPSSRYREPRLLTGRHHERPLRALEQDTERKRGETLKWIEIKKAPTPSVLTRTADERCRCSNCATAVGYDFMYDRQFHQKRHVPIVDCGSTLAQVDAERPANAVAAGVTA